MKRLTNKQTNKQTTYLLSGLLIFFMVLSCAEEVRQDTHVEGESSIERRSDGCFDGSGCQSYSDTIHLNLASFVEINDVSYYTDRPACQYPSVLVSYDYYICETSNETRDIVFDNMEIIHLCPELEAYLAQLQSTVTNGFQDYRDAYELIRHDLSITMVQEATKKIVHEVPSLLNQSSVKTEYYSQDCYKFCWQNPGQVFSNLIKMDCGESCCKRSVTLKVLDSAHKEFPPRRRYKIERYSPVSYESTGESNCEDDSTCVTPCEMTPCGNPHEK